MAITSVDSKEELEELNEELGEHNDVKDIKATDDEEEYLNEGDKKFQVFYDELLKDCGKCVKVAKSAVKKMKRIEEDHKSTLVQLRDAKCEVENLKEELLNSYSKIKFLELEVIQANEKVERITTKKLENVLTSQKSFSDKIGLGCIGRGSSSVEPKREMKFVSARVVEKLEVKRPNLENKAIAAKYKAKRKSLHKN